MNDKEPKYWSEDDTLVFFSELYERYDQEFVNVVVTPFRQYVIDYVDKYVEEHYLKTN